MALSPSFLLGFVLVALIAGDWFANDFAGTLFLARELSGLIDLMAVWR